MEVVGINKGTDLLCEVPAPPSFLGAGAKKHFKEVGKRLITAKILKAIHITALAVFAENLEQWEWAIKEIRAKNRKEKGSGYIQKFSTGAKNISVEITLKRDAEKAMMQCFKQFGIDPKSEKELKGIIDPEQGDLFEGFKNKKHG